MSALSYLIGAFGIFLFLEIILTPAVVLGVYKSLISEKAEKLDFILGVLISCAWGVNSIALVYFATSLINILLF